MMAERAVRPSSPNAVLEPVEREKAAVASGNAGEYLAILAEDAQFLPPGSPAKCGAELRNWLEAFVREFRVEWLASSTTDVVAVGDLAYHVYAYTWRVTPQGGRRGENQQRQGPSHSSLSS